MKILQTEQHSHAWLLQQRRARVRNKLTPSRLFVGSFLLLILIGTLGLKVLPGMYTAAPISWLDALFTITSAVCVTGLTVVDTATVFTFAGQAWVLLFIQLGGLGIITFSTLIILALGRRLSLHHESISSSTVEVAPHVDVRELARDVVKITFLFEGIGAFLLFVMWLPDYTWHEALWHGVFHSVSAFCNAGFSTFSDNLVGAQNRPEIQMVVGGLIVFGGLGFLALEELKLFLRARRESKRFRMSLHSRIVLSMTVTLIVIGWFFFAMFEWNQTLDHLPVWEKLSNSLFMSITPRTAGFNTVDYAKTADSTNFLTILLMFVGGSPGSTAGGIKTTTLTLILLAAISRFRGAEIVSVAGRSVPPQTVQRAIGLAVVAFGIVTASIFVYTASELPHQSHTGEYFLRYMFEAASAFNTVGLSMGVTPGLTSLGKVITILLMFVGRVGPLTFASALSDGTSAQVERFRYAYENVVVE